MILQTFDSHDYPTDPMVALYQNYIRYTLTNHFIRRSSTAAGIPKIRELFWSRITQSFFFK